MNKICSCGRKMYEWSDVCWVCREKEEIKRIWKCSRDDKQVTNEKYVICPYCGSHYGEDDLHQSTELVCDECGKEFTLKVEYDVIYSTYQKNIKRR